MVLASAYSALLRPPAFAKGLGPLFDKELRIASRRRRAYVLRSVYTLLLLVFIATVWVPAVNLRGGGAMSRANMEWAAKVITRNIVWFQFYGAQLASIIIMSTAISEEVYGRTLCVLMTTPLSGRQVVMSKFVGRLVQILLLVATSLPLLALVRILGGIPWSYVVRCLCVTAATVTFAGAVSLFISTLCRRAHLVVVASVLSLAFLFFLLPVLVCHVREVSLWRLRGLASFAPVNPYVLMSQGMTRPFVLRGSPTSALFPTISCCILLLGGTVAILRGAMRLVNSVALRRAMGEPVLLDSLRRERREVEMVKGSPARRRRAIRRVVGPPMIWKELTCSLSRRETFISRSIIGAELVLILIAYLFPMMLSIVSYESLHLVYVFGFMGAGVFLTITASATMIGRERESQAWPLLLLTPLTDADILLGKFVGVLRRCGPVWLVLFAYVAGFAWAKCFRPLAVVHIVAMILSALLFLSATGFYFGTRCRRMTDAVTANLALAGVLWCILPIVAETATYGMGKNWASGRSLVYAMVPFGQAFAMVLTTLDAYVSTVSWFGRPLDASGLTVVMLVSMVGYLLVSLLFTWRAMRAFRRRI